VIAGLGGNDRLLGRGGSDTLCGGTGDDVVLGGAGIDWLLPGAGRDYASGGRDRINVVSYVRSPRGIKINLRTGIARGWGRDTVRNVHQVDGSHFPDVIIGDERGNALVAFKGNDRLRGGRGEDSLIGGPGDDDLNGGPGADYAVFIDSPNAVDASLTAGKATGEGRDTLDDMEHLLGSRFDDVLEGDAAANEIVGGTDGDDAISGGKGDDAVYRYYGQGTLAGGGGTDTVHYAFRGAIDLVSGTAAGTDFADEISGFENVVGGSERQTITGDAERNELVGGNGPDIIKAGGGDDVVDGGRGDDSLAGGEGVDRMNGGRGDDVCIEGEDVVQCEVPGGSRSLGARTDDGFLESSRYCERIRASIPSRDGSSNYLLRVRPRDSIVWCRLPMVLPMTNRPLMS
jgi:Ca2+-binding RTX toxin-like protein